MGTMNANQCRHRMGLILAFATVAVAGNAQQPVTPGKGETNRGAPSQETPESRALAEWQTKLRTTFAKVPASVIVDIPETRSPLAAKLLRPEVGTLRRYGWALDRDLVQRNGIYALVRPELPKTMDERGSTGPLLDALIAMKPEELQRIGREGTLVGDLAPEMQRLLINAADGIPVLVERMISGENVGVGVYGDAGAFATTPSGRVESVSVAEPKHTVDVAAANRPRPTNAKAVAEPLMAAPAGDLVFAEGDVMTLDRLATLIRKTWARNMDYDPRLGSTLIFLKGSFTSANLVPIAIELATPKAPVLIEWSRVSRLPLISGVVNLLGEDGKFKDREGQGTLTDADVQNGKKLSLEDLTAASPTFARRSGGRFAPGTSFELQRRIGISLFAPESGSSVFGSTVWIIEP